MKVTADYLRQLIKEETQGEMQFAPLETARQAYLQDPNDDTKHELGQMINKLVEPIMAKMGLWWEAEAYYNVGQLVFSNHDDMEVIIDPRGSRGGYDLKISPLPGAEDDFEVIEDTFGSMKGVTQFIYDLENPHADGMVGEPEAQTELPLENKMRVTKSQLQQVIREAIEEEMDFVRRRIITGDPVGTQEASDVAEFLETTHGLRFSRGGMGQMIEFLAALEESGDLERIGHSNK